MKGMTRIFTDNLRAYTEGKRVIANKGGTRSSKTYSIIQLLLLIANSKPCAITVCSESMPHLKRGALKDMREIVEKENLVEGKDFSVNLTDMIYTFPNQSTVEFFSIDNWGKVKGSRRDILFINEANRIPYETYRQLASRTTSTIFIDWNPDSEFWYETNGIQQRDTTQEIHSTYKDNPYLTPEQIAEIESNRIDENWWRVYGLGLTGSHAGIIYPNRHLIEGLPDTRGMLHTYGLDFGFSNDPTALVELWVDERNKAIYADEKIYKTGMLNRDIAVEMSRLGVSHTTEIFADAAEPKSIEELHRIYGFNVKPSYKPALLTQIQFVQGFEMFITKDSLNLIREGRNYKWKSDMDGNNVNEPVDIWNHALDALRYAVYTPLRGRIKGGVRSSTLSHLPDTQ